MPARKITFNGVPNSFEWQVGNTTRFINFNTVTDVEYKEDCSTFDVYCGQTIVSVPNDLREQFKAKYEEWKKQMKEYKVGDTIYVQGRVEQIDKYDTSLHYYVDFVNGAVWIPSDTIIDELPTVEPVKPVLPKNVAEEMEHAKDDDCGNFFSYLADSNKYPVTLKYAFTWGADDAKIKILSDAWFNGYTIEQEPRYKVYVTGTNKQYMYVKRGELAKAHNKKATPITPQSIGNYITAGVSHRDLYWFTDEEITKFDLQDCEKELVADDSED